MIRKNTGFLSKIENYILYRLVKFVPRWIKSDLLTLTAFLAALFIGIGYVFIKKNSNLLLLINLLIFLHWLTDGLDGKLAKHRNVARPNYGFYIDHICDCCSVIFIASGILFSSLANHLIIFLVIMMILLSLIHSYLKTVATETFDLSIGMIGGTEMRASLILINFIIYFFGNPLLRFLNFTLSMFDFMGILVILIYGPTLIKTILLTAVRLHYKDTGKVKSIKSPKNEAVLKNLKEQ